MRADFIRGIILTMIAPMTETEALNEKGLQRLIYFLWVLVWLCVWQHRLKISLVSKIVLEIFPKV